MDILPYLLLAAVVVVVIWVALRNRRPELPYGNPYTLFDFTTGRGEEHPTAFLSGYSGFVHADGYTGYNPVHGSGARHLGCWAHVRRKFVEARTNNAAKAS